MLEPGIYRLMVDLPNPMKIDRRRADWEHQPVFKAGSLFIRADLDVDVDIPVPKIGMRKYSVWTYRTVKSVQPLVDALEDKVKVIDPLSALEMLSLYHRQVLLNSSGPDIIVKELLKEGKLTMEGIDELLHRINRRPA